MDSAWLLLAIFTLNFIDIAKKAKDNFAYCKLLMEYVYGKPKESVDMNIGDIVTEIKFIDE